MLDPAPTAPPAASPTAQVLIVDESEENREVLRLLLQRRGATIHEAAETDRGLDLFRSVRPDLVVLDADAMDGAGFASGDELRQASRREQVPLVVLGRVQLDGARTGNASGDHMLRKPYHYAPLIRTIEQLLQGVSARE